MLHFEMKVLHIDMTHLICHSCIGIAEAVDLFMCPEGRVTIPFTRLLLRRASRQDTPSLMT